MNTQTDASCLCATYHPYPMAPMDGKGCYLIDNEGNSYLDFMSGIGVNIFGYGYSAWQQAMIKQIYRLTHCSNLLMNEQAIECAKLLCEKTGCEKVFFANSGVESNEAAIKAARKYSHDRYGVDRYEILTLTNSFHGRTITALSANGQSIFHQHFMPFTAGFRHVHTNNIDDLHKKISEKTCAIMIELIQGEGGVNEISAAFAAEIQKICDANDILLIIDEVQTGIGRCGSLFLYEQYHLHPDIVTSAKALGAGIPIGAALFFHKTAAVFQQGDHGSTFGGNMLACASASFVLRHLDEALYHAISENGIYLKQQLLQCPKIERVSGRGLMLGIAFDHLSAQNIAKRCFENGLLVSTAKNHLRLLPPYIITKQEIDHGVTILKAILATEGE